MIEKLSIKVSVIIPVYNAASHLTSCIDSLLNQTLDDCEFIFVNDGSQDQSQIIIEQFRSQDKRIRLVNQTNQGVSVARNAGLKLARGEYAGFVDADDHVESVMFERLYGTAKENKCDVVLSNFRSEMDGQETFITYPFKQNVLLDEEYIKQEIIPFLLKSDQLNSVCNKIFKLDLIRTQEIEFPQGIALGEDGIFNLRFFSSAKRLNYINEAFYFYREVVGSATRNLKNKDYFSSALATYSRELPELNNVIDFNRIKQLKAQKLIQNTLSLIHLYFNPTKEVSFEKRYRYVKEMLHNSQLREAHQLCNQAFLNQLGRYEKVMLQFIEKRFAMGLYCITAYSRFRNK